MTPERRREVIGRRIRGRRQARNAEAYCEHYEPDTDESTVDAGGPAHRVKQPTMDMEYGLGILVR